MCIPRRLTVWKILIWVSGTGSKVYNPVGGNGVYHPDTPVFAGQHIFKANDDIVAALDERKVLLCHAPFQHSYPHCWRHKTPIIFRATPQWFVSMTATACSLPQKRGRGRAVDTRLGPGAHRQYAGGAARLVYFPAAHLGVPIALFVHNTTGEIHPTRNL